MTFIWEDVNITDGIYKGCNSLPPEKVRMNEKKTLRNVTLIMH